MHEIINQYFQILLDCFKYDIHVFSMPWVYYWIFPILFYIWFFIVKWIVLTIPIMIPFYVLMWFIDGIKDMFYEKRKFEEYKEELKNKYKSGGLYHEDN